MKKRFVVESTSDQRSVQKDQKHVLGCYDDDEKLLILSVQNK